MGKKCIPGVFCIENMTLFVLLCILVIVAYIYYIQFVKFSKHEKENTKIIVVNQSANPSPPPVLGMITQQTNPMTDMYSPPLKIDADIYPTRGIPINVQTRGLNTSYQQVGILTPVNRASKDMILPLMGRRIMSGRDKWQYYTMSTTGNLNTKLPVSVNGKSCTGEYGCDSIMNGDTIYVEGYNDTFKATIYENNLFSYIPF
jgi:hypothetical protein